MFENIFRLRRTTLEAHNENPGHFDEAAAHPSAVRALATGVALATSLDTSTAAVVGIYDYAHRYRDRGRRSA